MPACLRRRRRKLGVADGDMLRLEAAGEGDPLNPLELPVLVQAGQHDRVVGVALGYGSVLSERFANIGPQWLQAGPTVGPNGLVGKNAAPMLQWAEGSLRFIRDGVRLTKTAGQHPLASTQSYSLLTVPPRFAIAGSRTSADHPRNDTRGLSARNGPQGHDAATAEKNRRPLAR